MSASASVYLIGGAFFSTGGYASVLQVVNEPASPSAMVAIGGSWRFWRHRDLGW